MTWEQAFDLMAEKCKAALKAKGPSAIAMFMSGQSTLWEGYAAVKLMKTGLRSNNIDPNARHCMASAAAALMRTFGIGEPNGSRNKIAPSSAVAASSNVSQSDTDAAPASRKPRSSSMGPAIPPAITAPSNRKPWRRQRALRKAARK